eukprot:TRINITY_DN2821_c0_g1_i1.p1 TRINITY_DN2821_c0_g1~~TRINITY_DN2821_c0_g1_i1.p1  ORF type:complete len:642 (+),score=173.96 TRINITY_DN2821_c0_g1_i1:49-1974(+)
MKKSTSITPKKTLSTPSNRNSAPVSSSPRKKLVPNKDFMSSKSKDDNLFGGNVKGEPVSDKIFAAAQSNGALNISNRSLDAFPEQVFQLIDKDFSNGTGTWWERETLKRIDASSNNIVDVPPQIQMFAESLTSLILNNNELSTIPEEIYLLVLLAKLDLSHNRITKLPSGISKLENLGELLLGNNKLSDLPGDFGEIPKLSRLDLTKNSMKNLPALRLKDLQYLQISHNQLEDLPEDFFNEKPILAEIYVNNNKLKKFPSIKQLKSLLRIDLRENQLKNLPEISENVPVKEVFLGFNLISTISGSEPFFNLKEINLLDLADNGLMEVPKEICNLKSLTSLDIRNNSVKFLPPEIGFMPNLTKFYVEGNLLKSVPRQLVEKGSKAILDYLKTRVSEETIATIPNSPVKKEKDPIKYKLMEATSSGTCNLAGKNLSELPEDVFELDIGKLDASKNSLSFLPNSIENLKKLAEIDLNFNKISVLPEQLSKCQHVKDVSLSNNQFSKFPSVLLELRNLSRLFLDYNRLDNIPDEVYRLPNIHTLSLTFNLIQSFPDVGTMSKTLQYLVLGNNKINSFGVKTPENCTLLALNLENNNISQVPPELGLCTTIRSLLLLGNPIKSIRVSQLEKPASQILEYLRSRIVT